MKWRLMQESNRMAASQLGGEYRRRRGALAELRYVVDGSVDHYGKRVGPDDDISLVDLDGDVTMTMTGPGIDLWVRFWVEGPSL